MKALWCGVATIALMMALPASAQDAPLEAAAATNANTPTTAAAPTPGTARQVYTPEDFARYVPRNAYDMVSQVPGFEIRTSDQQRGLGQATGNVLFNGQRPSTKSDDIFTLLGRIPANNVTRIEILDGASLDIPGLSGQVANIVFDVDGFSGQFSWKPRIRAHYADALLTRGDISATGRSGDIKYEIGLNNDDSARSSAGGPTMIRDGVGQIIEQRDDVWTSDYDTPKLSAKLNWDMPGSAVANLNAHYQRIYDRFHETGDRVTVGQADSERTVRSNADSWNYELGGDLEFALGSGRLKMIGLRSFSREPYWQEVITSYADGAPATGDRYEQRGNLGETIGRGEYSWKMLGGDWQFSAEAAFNSLKSNAALSTLNNDGNFVAVPFPGAVAGVKEDRYEVMLSFGRPLANNLTLQILGGAEHSTLAQTGPDGVTRKFFRPKGSISLAWKPGDGFDISAKLHRRVLQLDFYDFLARAFLDDDNANAGNSDLRPRQDWSFEGEISKTLGRWGSTKLQLIYRDVEDYVDIVPVPGGESIGNIPSSWASALDWTSTINLDPAGIRGMKLETQLLFQKSQLRDPFTGEMREWSRFTDTLASLSLRHDIPDGDWAWGGDAEYSHQQPSYRSNQVDRVWEGPVWASLFIENKNVFGMTARATVHNIFNARSRRERVVYQGLRNASSVAFYEDRDRLIGPMFSIALSGSF